MKTIALEEHFTTPEIVGAAARHEKDDPSGNFKPPFRDQLLDLGAARLADMDAAGIDLQVLSLPGSGLDKLDPDTATALARGANDRAAATVREYPNRFAAFASLDLQDPEAAAIEMRRCVGEMGFKGAMVHGTTGGLFLDHPRFAPVFAAAQALGVPIYLHPAPPPEPVQESYFGGLPSPFGQMLSTAAWGWHAETGLHALRLMAGGVFDRFPDVQIILGHMGEDLPFSVARADYLFERAPEPLARRPSEILRSNFHLTVSGYFTLPPLRCALEMVGVDRVLFAVDFPYSKNSEGRQFLDSLPLGDEDKAKITHGNAERLLGLQGPATM